MALIFLPPYSPELNPVEHIWESIREDGFRNEVFNSIEGVEDQLMQSLAALGKRSRISGKHDRISLDR